MTLRTEFQLGPAGDDLYAELLEAHAGISDSDSARLNTRLVLILMNHIGDPEVIREALRKARRGLGERNNSCSQADTA